MRRPFARRARAATVSDRPGREDAGIEPERRGLRVSGFLERLHLALERWIDLDPLAAARFRPFVRREGGGAREGLAQVGRERLGQRARGPERAF